MTPAALNPPPPNRPHLSVPGKHSRREFLRRSAMLAGAGVAAPWVLDLAGLSAAAGADAADEYKAIVCVFLFGGNDHNDTIVPDDVSSYDMYRSLRTGIARDRTSLLTLDPIGGFNDGRSVGFAPEWAGLKSLFDQQKLALIANVGTLIAPTTKSSYAVQSNRPPQLFSHNDQQSLWQSSAPEGATTGWGGRLADLLLDDNGADSVFTCMSVAGNAVMMTGREAVQFQVSSKGVTKLESRFSSSSVLNGLDEVMRLDGVGLFPNSYSTITNRALSTSDRLSTAVDAVAPTSAVFPTSRLGAQLKMVSKLIAAGRTTLGLRRQVFFVAAGGFDNHDGIVDKHPALLADLSNSLSAFYVSTAEIGAADAVTTFTASDFGRTLVGNGNGSDHGWGSHHIVLGGSVRGRRSYGLLPVVADDGPDDVGRGRLLPTTAVEQYTSTIAKWMGATGNELTAVVPNVGRYATDDLGFLADSVEPDPGITDGVRNVGLQPATRVPTN